MLPLAPTLFSTITFVPSASESGFEIARAMMSDEPPGVYGTMIFTGDPASDGTAGSAAHAVVAPSEDRTGAAASARSVSRRPELKRVMGKPSGGSGCVAQGSTID